MANHSGCALHARAEVALAVAGVRCAACVATIKSRIGALEGVIAIEVQLPGERARLIWDPARQRLGAILETMAKMGYRAAPVSALATAAARKQEVRSASRRLFVAGFGMMQVMMYSIPAYVTNDGIAAEHALLLRWASLIMNTSETPHDYRIRVAGPPGAEVVGIDGPVTIAASSAQTVPLRVRVPDSVLAPGANRIEFTVAAIDDPLLAVNEKSTFMLPR